MNLFITILKLIAIFLLLFIICLMISLGWTMFAHWNTDIALFTVEQRTALLQRAVTFTLVLIGIIAIATVP